MDEPAAREHEHPDVTLAQLRNAVIDNAALLELAFGLASSFVRALPHLPLHQAVDQLHNLIDYAATALGVETQPEADSSGGDGE